MIEKSHDYCAFAHWYSCVRNEDLYRAFWSQSRQLFLGAEFDIALRPRTVRFVGFPSVIVT